MTAQCYFLEDYYCVHIHWVACSSRADNCRLTQSPAHIQFFVPCLAEHRTSFNITYLSSTEDLCHLTYNESLGSSVVRASRSWV